MPSDSWAAAKISLGCCQFCTAVNQEPDSCVVLWIHFLWGIFQAMSIIKINTFKDLAVVSV